MKVVIYKQDDGQIAVLSPTSESLEHHSILEVGVKDVPEGKPFAIVNISDLPQGIPQEVWEVDDDDLKDGVGGRSNEF
ncbi:hypothetical protein M316_0112 [Nitrincola phage 1M3-16]|uniref:hypothetical protein n=1 Tax=Nitrincola phage 1M3-16 TaxID=1472912 RepID=UPI000444E6B3|nr:hypothetical protein GJ22_gp040 [Nitrincola phage 1M3-16]AHX01177.1 hypothetical protein M316_0112 [Nitrincola phage 1M3-16]